MKRIYIFAVIVLMAVVSGSAQQISKFFDKYDDVEDVTSVYVSKAMLRMMPDVKTGDMDLSGLSGKLDCIRILSSNNNDMARKLKTDADKVLNANGYEVLVKVSEGKEKTNIYMKSDDKGVNEYFIVNEEPGDFNAILIVGKLTPEDVQKMVNK
ncbi:MAG: DUF4252 domain-containing protein [Muribaculaceae bacterium]|nr:DUF4252 domain-containing protein [Muribaculaceae bacterium]